MPKTLNLLKWSDKIKSRKTAEWGLEPGCLDSNLGSSAFWLYELEQVI